MLFIGSGAKNRNPSRGRPVGRDAIAVEVHIPGAALPEGWLVYDAQLRGSGAARQSAGEADS